MRNFQDHDAAARFCRPHDKIRDRLRSRHYHRQVISVSSVAPNSPEVPGLRLTSRTTHVARHLTDPREMRRLAFYGARHDPSRP
jgi:hypothetical protein